MIIQPIPPNHSQRPMTMTRTARAISGVAPLTQLGVIRVTGLDAAKFLQGQLTQEVALLGLSEAHLAAFCNAKGRMQASFVMFKRMAGADEEILLVCSRDILGATLKRLSMFVLRAKAKLSDASAEFALYGLTGDALNAIESIAGGTRPAWAKADIDAANLVFLYPGAGQPRALWCAPADAAPPAGAPLDLALWHWLSVQSGIAMITQPIFEAFVPQMLNYESVGGVNFKKGCYPGQEVVARSQFRGTLKRRAFVVHSPALLQAGQTQPPAALSNAIERMAPALRVLRHGDGGLALFNGSREESGALVDLVLTQAGRGGRGPSALTDGGFHRLQAGRSVLIVDCGAPPPHGVDRYAHAGTLAMELSIGRDRMIVNCGAFPAGPPVWRDAARATAAHSTLVIADHNSSELRPDGLGRRPVDVKAQRQEANGAHWLEAHHDGWLKPFGAIHRRRLYVSESGEDIRGEDVIEAAQPQPFTLRFHLHPDVQASMQQDGEAVLLRLRSGGGWRLRADHARLSLEESIYLGGAEPRRTEQVVLVGRADGPQQVKWAISKVG